VAGVFQPPSHVDGAAQYHGVVERRVTDLSGWEYIDNGVAGKTGTKRLGDAGRNLPGGPMFAGGADENPHDYRSILWISLAIVRPWDGRSRQHPGAGDPLLLPAREFAGAVRQAVPDAQRVDDGGEPGTVGLAAGDVDRQGDVLARPWCSIMTVGAGVHAAIPD
jgi:hypothetical protein